MRAAAVTLLFASVTLAADPPTDLVEQQFRNLDKNKDGLVSPEELKANRFIAEMREGSEKDRDGNLSLDSVRMHLSQMFLGRDPRPGSKLEPVRVGPKVLKPAEAGVGQQVPDIAFKDIT